MHDESGQEIDGGRDDYYAWSAAFISYVHANRGRGCALPLCALALHLHQRCQGDEARPHVRLGDGRRARGRVCTGSRRPHLLLARQASMTYEKLPARRFTAHCDIVVSREKEQISVIGGNVNHAVTMKHVPVTADGRLADPGTACSTRAIPGSSCCASFMIVSCTCAPGAGQRMLDPGTYRCSSPLRTKLSPPFSGPPKSPTAAGIRASGLGVRERNDTANCSPNGNFSPKLGAWPIYSTSFFRLTFQRPSLIPQPEGWYPFALHLGSGRRFRTLRFQPQAA